MNTYYCVVETYDNRGRVTAAIVVSRQAEEQPEDSFYSTKQKDIYVEWYASYGDALQAVENAKRA